MQTPIDERRYLIPFRSQLLPAIFTDTLVIGSGVAGLRAGLAAAEHGDVIIVAKDELEKIISQFMAMSETIQSNFSEMKEKLDNVENTIKEEMA